MHMAHLHLRELAFQMRSDELRKYGQEVLARDPKREAPAEVLDLMAYLIACDFVGAEAKINTIKFRFKETSDEIYVNEATNLAKSFINFAFGRFDEFEIAAQLFLDNHEMSPDIEEGEYLDVLRLKAQKHLIMDEYEDLRKTYQEMVDYKVPFKSTNLLFLIDSVKALVLLADGEYFKAIEVAERNIEIARQNGYTGLMTPIDSMFVLAGSYFASNRARESQDLYFQIRKLAEELNMWPWYFISDGFIARDLAFQRDMAGALALVREERGLLSQFNFQHQLAFIPDVNELYVRFLVQDWDRVEVLANRVPKLNFVTQISTFLRELAGEDMLPYIESLPESTARERVYKLLALADYYKQKESIAVDYMYQALQVVEQSGAIEIVLRQVELLEIILKAIAKRPTVLLEDLATRLTERIHHRNKNDLDKLPTPLTSRELEIVRHLATGKPISEIGITLHVSINTMKTHLRNIYRKLAVDGREKAVEKAKELFLI